MTCIAYKGGRLAVDTQISAGYSYSYHVEKLMRVAEQGCWLAMCGSVSHFKDFLAWFNGEKSSEQIPKFEDDSFGAIALYDNGQVRLYEESLDYIDHPPDKPCAMGSGSAAALGAMYAGAEADVAVHIASLIDPATGGEVQSVLAGEKPKRRRQKAAPKKKSQAARTKPRGTA